jgi:hypothetical protein
VLAFRVDSFSLSLLAVGRKPLAAGRNAQIQYAAGRTRLR